MNLTLEQMRGAVQRKNNELQSNPFTIKEDEEHGLIIFNYSYAFPGLFEGPDEALLRECRGLIFKDGKLLSRPYHKFFNVNEHSETEKKALPFHERHYILEKLDGSMIRPLLLNNKVVFASKAGITEVSQQVDEWVKEHPNYVEFCLDVMDLNLTPIFEWCSRKNRVVIDHPIDRLVLTAIRDNRYGNYFSYDEMVFGSQDYGIEVVKAYDFNIQDHVEGFFQHVRNLKNMEGFVIRWDNGLMTKVKADEYIQLHKTLDIMRSEKIIVELIVENRIDDVLPMLSKEDSTKVLAFQKVMLENIENKAKELAQIVRREYIVLKCSGFSDKVMKKQFAIHTANDHEARAVLFKLWQAAEKGKYLDSVAFDLILQTIKNKKLDDVRYLIGDLNWREYDGQ